MVWQAISCYNWANLFGEERGYRIEKGMQFRELMRG